MEWTIKHNIPKPLFNLDFKHPNSLFNLIYVCTLWKVICVARHKEKPNVVAEINTAKIKFKREVQIAHILFPETYPSVGRFNKPNLLDLFSLLGSHDQSISDDDDP